LKKYNVNELWDKKDEPSNDKEKASSQEEVDTAQTVEAKVE
jgi:hypothetical protein